MRFPTSALVLAIVVGSRLPTFAADVPSPVPSATVTTSTDRYAHCPQGIVFVHRAGPYYTFVVGTHETSTTSFELQVASARSTFHYHVDALKIDGVAKLGDAKWQIAKAISLVFPAPDIVTTVTIFPAESACYPTQLHIPFGTTSEQSLHARIADSLTRSTIALLPDDPQPTPDAPCAVANAEAVPIYQPRADYPEIAKSQGASGTAIVLATISEIGGVMSAKITKSTGNAALDNSAIASVKVSTWQPAVRDCVPVPSAYYLTISFPG